jgi:DNA-binding Lrp family transcriptional regulator
MRENRKRLKDVEIKVIAELMKDSRRSDREIAKAVGSSQPTISRTIKKLEKEGYIKEYTMIPDFGRLGYQIMAFNFIGKQETIKEDERSALRKAALETEKKDPIACMTVADGTGLKKGRILTFLYEDYSSYRKGVERIRRLPHVEADDVESFIVDLSDEDNFRVLSLREVARHFEARMQNVA